MPLVTRRIAPVPLSKRRWDRTARNDASPPDQGLCRPLRRFVSLAQLERRRASQTLRYLFSLYTYIHTYTRGLHDRSRHRIGRRGPITCLQHHVPRVQGRRPLTPAPQHPRLYTSRQKLKKRKEKKIVCFSHPAPAMQRLDRSYSYRIRCLDRSYEPRVFCIQYTYISSLKRLSLSRAFCETNEWSGVEWTMDDGRPTAPCPRRFSGSWFQPRLTRRRTRSRAPAVCTCSTFCPEER